MIGIMLLGCTGFAQQTDSIRVPPTDTVLVAMHIDFLYQRIMDEVESLAEEGFESGMPDGSGDEEMAERFEELLEEYELCRSTPVNLNSGEADRLATMGLITPFQLEGIRRYQRQYGDLLFAGELLMIEGLDPRTVAVITPIVCFGKNDWEQDRERVTLKNAVTRGKHQLTMNYGQKLNNSEAYDAVSDTAMLERPNAYYLGSPQKLQLKYSYHYGTRFRCGVAMEKDAGEPFFHGSLSDTLRQLVERHRRPGFDFYGAHLFLSDLPLGKKGGWTLRALALGDYQLSFGQGLTLWSGMSFGKSSGSSSVIKRGAGARPKASAGEGRFFRGAAATLSFRDFEATVFWSSRRIDATVSEPDTLGDGMAMSLDDAESPSVIATALQESGYHRSLGELAKRHAIRQQVFGGRLAYVGPQLEIGGTAYHLRLSAPLQLKPSKYNQFYFQGDHLTVGGIDFRWQLARAAFFGELSMSGNEAFAGVAGLTVKPAGYIDFTLFYRNYGLRYQNLLSGAVKESSRGQAEEGVYLGLQCAPAPRWNLLAHCDFFRFKWLTSQVYCPSWGQEYSLKVLHQISHAATMQFHFKSKTKMKNSTDGQVFSHYPIFYTKRTAQFLLSYTLFGDWVFGNRASYIHYLNDDGIDSRGYFICQDIAYKPEGKPYSLAFRYALFDSDDYNSRISVYENDVLGAFSIPSLFGHGSRIYLLGKIKMFDALALYTRVGGTVSKEDMKTDIKVEAVWKF